MLKVGDTFDSRYTILAELGKGGMGEVFLAQQTDIDRQVALKILVRGERIDEPSRRRFLREFQILSTLSHPQIMCFYHMAMTEQGMLYAACEYIDGVTLLKVLNTQGKFGWQRLLRICVQVCAAMESAHAQGIVHRDLKPENIMLLNKERESSIDEDRIKIIDFGLSRLFSTEEAEAQKLTSTGQLLGSVHYMSPEQCAGEKVDPRSDIYSLGCVMFELLSGEKLFTADNPIGILHQQRNSDHVERLNTLSDFVPPELIRIMQQMLNKIPEERYSSMQAIKEELDALLADNSLHEPAISAKSAKKPYSVLALSLVSILVVSTLAALLYFSYFRTAKTRPSPASTPAKIAKAKDRKEESLEHFIALHKGSSAKLAEALMDLALIKSLKQDFVSAEALIKKAITIQKAKLGKTNMHVGDSLAELSACYKSQGKTEAAIKAAQESEQIYQQVLEPDNMRFAASCMALGVLYSDCKDYSNAEKSYRKALELVQSTWKGNPESVAVFLQLAAIYMEQDRFAEAESLINKSLKITESIYGKQSYEYANNLSSLADCYDRQKAVTKSEQLYENCVKTMEEIGQTDRQDYSNMKIRLAFCYISQQKYQKVEKLCEQVKSRLEHKALTNNQAYFDSLSLPVSCCEETGRFEEAQKLLEDFCKKIELATGPLSQQTADSQQRLIQFLLRYGKTREVEALFSKILRHTEIAFGADSLETAECLWKLAYACICNMRFSEAEKLLTRSLDISERKSPSDKVILFDRTLRLTDCYLRCGNVKQALPLMQKCAEFVYAMKNKKTNQTLDRALDLARHYCTIGRFEQSKSLIEHALKLSKLEDGPESPSYVVALMALANNYRQHYRSPQADQYFAEALKLTKTKNISSLQIECLQNCAYNLNFQGRYEESGRIYREVLLMERRSGRRPNALEGEISSLADSRWGEGKYKQHYRLVEFIIALNKQKPKADSTEQVQNYIGHYYLQLAQYEKAIPYIERAVKIIEPDKNLARRWYKSDYLCRLARCYRAEGKFQEAAPKFEQALKIVELVEGTRSSTYAAILRELAQLYLLMGKTKEAESMMLESQAVLEALYGSENLLAASGLSDVAHLYAANENYSEANKYFERALTVTRNASGTDNLYTILDVIELAYCYSDQGRFQESEALVRSCLNSQTLKKAVPHRAWTMQVLADTLLSEGKTQEAAQIIKSIPAIAVEEIISIDTINCNDYFCRARLLREQGRLKSAERWIRRWLDLEEHSQKRSNLHMAGGYELLATICARQGKRKEVETAFKRCIEIWKQQSCPNKSIYAECLRAYSCFLKTENRQKESLEWEAKAQHIESEAIKVLTTGLNRTLDQL